MIVHIECVYRLSYALRQKVFCTIIDNYGYVEIFVCLMQRLIRIGCLFTETSTYLRKVGVVK